jgi:hypothetical protein
MKNKSDEDEVWRKNTDWMCAVGFDGIPQTDFLAVGLMD